MVTKTELGTYAVGGDGVLASGAVLDAFVQYFSDNNLCLTPKQRFYRVLVAAGMGLAIGGAGMGLTALMVRAKYATTTAAGASTVATLMIGAANELFVKPRVFEAFELQ
ncbi:MAG: hypothetical protein HC822_22535 [Oscillochloris sp.]|nr:hypothetical protein [Oscillochloris sp.]